MMRAPQALAQSIRPTVLAGSHAFSRGGMGSRHKIATLAMAAALAALCGIAAARAEVRVSGTAGTVVVRAKAATLTDVVAGLEAASHARIEVKGATSRQFTGIYSGSLQEVLARLLVGIDRIVHTAPDRITIVLVMPDAGHPVVVAVTQDDGGGSGVQGWMPTARQVASAAPMPQPHTAQPGPAAEDAEPSGVQGWVPTAIQVASIAAPPQTQTAGAATANNPAAAEPSGVQGWMPVATATQPAPVAAAAPGHDAIAADDGAEGGVQGWMPTPAKAN
jgi:hypothetical protein